MGVSTCASSMHKRSITGQILLPLPRPRMQRVPVQEQQCLFAAASRCRKDQPHSVLNRKNSSHMKQTVIYTFLFALALCGGAFFLLKDQRTGSHNVVIMPHLTPPLATPVATPWISPDGSKTLVMKTTIGADARKTYSFSVQESPSLGEHLVYSKTLDVGDEMSIPFNSWSPNNQYFFIQEKGKD